MTKNSTGTGHTILDGILEYLKQNDINDISKQRTAPEADSVSDGGEWYLHCEYANIFLDDGKVHLEVIRPKHYIEYHGLEDSFSFVS
jgi:hypothetical protein